MQILVGTKTGEIQLFDIAASVCLATVKAHTAEVWSISIRPDKRKFMSGSADKEVKFWEFDLVEDREYSEVCVRVCVCVCASKRQEGECATIFLVVYTPS